MDDDFILAKTYDRFRDFVKEQLRKRPNDSLDTKAFDDLDKKKHGVTHMAINLENVVQGNEFLFSKIKEFHKDAKIVQQDKIEDTGSNYIAYVPYFKRSNNNKKYYGKSNKKISPPNTSFLLIYMFILILIIILAIFKTNRSDWNFILGQ